jgi:hypothetical protein
MRLPASLLALAALVLPALAGADAETEARYPFDPACPWGRIANGRGMLLRCLTRAEAERVAGTDPQKLDARGALPTETPPSKPAAETAPRQAPAPAPRAYTLKIGPVTADEGEVALGALHRPEDRYRQCIDDNGGLLAPQGKIVIDFLVRGERSRAEGAEVGSFVGVTREAARCVATVVDRRQVGTPTVPMTGASLPFELREKK